MKLLKTLRKEKRKKKTVLQVYEGKQKKEKKNDIGDLLFRPSRSHQWGGESAPDNKFVWFQNQKSLRGKSDRKERKESTRWVKKKKQKKKR